MPIDDVSEFTLVPEKLWETVKVNGNIYTVPSLAFNDSGVTCYFNKAYISEQQFSDFDGNISELGGILDGLTGGEDFLPIYYNKEPCFQDKPAEKMSTIPYRQTPFPSDTVPTMPLEKP